MESDLVFVYGTLRVGEVNHELLSKAILIVSQAWVIGTLYDTEDGYPALKESESGVVFGEIYRVNNKELNTLDLLEGYKESYDNNLYVRKKMTIETDLKKMEAYVYVIAPNKENILMNEIESGDWKTYNWIKKDPVRFLYFAYGSCMDHERFIEDNVSHFFTDIIGTATLSRYELRFARHSIDGGRADIKEGRGIVEGIIYLLPLEALEYLFKREGVNARIYRPVLLTLDCNNQLLGEVLSFTVINKEEDLAPPNHYAAEVLRGAKKHLSRQYNDFLKQYFLQLGVNIEKLEKSL